MNYISIFIVFFIIYILIYFHKKPAVEGFEESTVDLVIARYEEDLTWVNDVSNNFTRILIYNKGSPYKFNNIPTIPLKNIGKEGHTYLYHVLNNFDSLADVTVFVSGSTWTYEQKKNEFLKIIDHLKHTKSSIIFADKSSTRIESDKNFVLDEYKITNEANFKKNPDQKLTPSLIRPLSRWFETRFPYEEFTCPSGRGTVAASRKDILSKPKSHYQTLFDEISVKNPEVGHYFERTWAHIFSIPDDKCKTY